MRKAAVVSLSCDPDRLLTNNHLGIKSGDQKKLLNDVILLLNDKRLREEYTERAFKYSQKHYSEANLDTLINDHFNR